MVRREYGEGSVHRLHRKDCPHMGERDAKCGCKWRFTIDTGYTGTGGRKRTVRTANTEAEARRKGRDLKADIAKAGQAAAADARRKTIRSWATDWLALREHDVRPATWQSYHWAVTNYIVPALGNVRLADIKPAHLRDLDKAARDTGAPTAGKVRGVLLNMLRAALAEGHHVPPAIFEASAPTRRPHRTDRQALSVPEAVAVLHAAAETHGGVRWLVGLYQGFRQGETLGLTWDRLDLDNGWAEISWQLQAIPYRKRFDTTSGFRVPDDYDARHLVGRFHLTRPKTASGERVVPLVPVVAEALRVWRDTAPANPHGLVFARENGWPIDKADDADQWRALQELAGISHPGSRAYVGHEMRNTTATLLLDSGVDPSTIMALLGHSNIITSRGYHTAQEGAMRAALGNIEQAFTTRQIEE